jgi:hypothetical protein
VNFKHRFNDKDLGGFTNIEVSFLTQLPESKETAQGFHFETNGDVKTDSVDVIGENCGWINNIIVTPQC